MGRLSLLLWPGALVVGLAAEWVGFGWDDARHWLPDLITGWSMVAGGLLTWQAQPRSRIGVLFVLTGFSWYLGNFSHTGWAVVDWLASVGVFVHRGPLAHALLCYPSGRLTTVRLRFLVAFYYLAALLSLWRDDVLSIVLSVLLAAALADEHRRTVGPTRASQLLATQVGGTVAAVLALGAVARIVAPTGAAAYPALIAYQAVLVAAVVTLAARSQSGHAGLTALVVELGDGRASTVREALAQALGDSSLQIGYWAPDGGGYVDTSGRPIILPPQGSRSMTRLDRDGRPVAVVLHDPAVLSDPTLIDAVASATRLAATNARLQVAVRAQLDQLKESRRRIVDAADEEGRRLERRLRDGPERRLAELAGTLPGIEDPATAQLATRLAGTRSELRRLAHGLHPSTLSERGLTEALSTLAQRCPVPVDLAVSTSVPDRLAPAIYYLCAEALANVAKYADATTVRLTVDTVNSGVVVTVADDGVGGADPERGSGLRGLADRLDTLGGWLRIDSAPGRGTELTAQLPVAGDGSPVGTP
jgi:signal transduction histidine kinase